MLIKDITSEYLIEKNCSHEFLYYVLKDFTSQKRKYNKAIQQISVARIQEDPEYLNNKDIYDKKYKELNDAADMISEKRVIINKRLKELEQQKKKELEQQKKDEVIDTTNDKDKFFDALLDSAPSDLKTYIIKLKEEGRLKII